MNRFEFMEIAGYEVTVETYDNMIEPAYLISRLNKREFINSINRDAVEFKPYDKIRQLARQACKKCSHETIHEERELIYKEIDKLREQTGYNYVVTDDEHFGHWYPARIDVYYRDGSPKEFINLC